MLDASLRTAPRRGQDAGFALALLVLAASIPSFMTIPFHAPWPLDFQNVWAFHHCGARNAPYSASGAACGDALGRDFIYPPLLYWSFAWTRWLDFERASHVWTVLVAVGTVASTLAWLPRADPAGTGGRREATFAALLLAQYPVLFALERGNNDVVVLALWTLAALALRAGRAGTAGALAGLSAVLKLYPAFACLVVGAGLVASAVRRPEARRSASAFAAGGALAVVIGLVATLPQTVVYLTEVLPPAARLEWPLTPFGHALRTLWPLWAGWALAAPLLAAWGLAAVRLADRDPILVLAGALAISTYFAGTSWDYNLITTYPLLVVLFTRAAGAGGLTAWALLLVGVVAIVGHRAAFTGSAGLERLHVALQWLFLVGAGAAAPRLARGAPREGRGAPTPTGAAPPAARGR